MGINSPGSCVPRAEHEQEEEQRYHRNEELPAQTSFVTAASLPRGLPQPGALARLGGAFGCAGVQLLPAASWGRVGEVIPSSDNSLGSLGKEQKRCLGCHPGNRVWSCFPQEAGDGGGWRPAAEHLSRVGLRALNSSLGITESFGAGGGGEVVQ